jgi:large conductance mechanosensitive channel
MEEIEMWNEFKKFALKGNVIDLAIGVVIGGAFGKIVSSLVNDIITPIVGLLLGGIDLTTKLSYTYHDADIKLGVFLQNIVDFFIIAFSIFLVIKFLSRFKRKEEAAPAAPTKHDLKEELLMEIRDLLKENSEKRSNETN